MLTELRWETKYSGLHSTFVDKAVKSIDIPFVPVCGMEIRTGDSTVKVESVLWDDNVNKFICDVSSYRIDDEWKEVDSFEE